MVASSLRWFCFQQEQPEIFLALSPTPALGLAGLGGGRWLPSLPPSEAPTVVSPRPLWFESQNREQRKPRDLSSPKTIWRGARVWEVAHEEKGVHISSGGGQSFQWPVRVGARMVRVEKYGWNIVLLLFLCTLLLVTLSPRHQSQGTSVEAAITLPSRCALQVCPSAAQLCGAQLPD